MTEIKPRMRRLDGEAVCDAECPSFRSDDCPRGCNLVTIEGDPCFPYYRARVAELEGIVDRARIYVHRHVGSNARLLSLLGEKGHCTYRGALAECHDIDCPIHGPQKTGEDE